MAMKTNILNRLKKLLHAPGVSGSEQLVAREVYEQLETIADEIYISTVGNIIAIKHGNEPGPTVAFGAHIDEVGFIVRNILADGFITMDKIGGIPQNIVLGRQVELGVNRIPGIIGTKPGHLQKPAEMFTVPAMDACFLDIGVNSKQEALDLGVRIGDPIHFKSDIMTMSNPDLISSRAIDNRIGCSIIIELFQSIEHVFFAGTVIGVFTVREEVGLLGASTALFGKEVDYVIAVDTIPVSDTPDFNPEQDYPVYLGKGPGFAVCERGATGRFQYAHPKVREIIEQSATQIQVNLQTLTFASASYSTDAAAFSLTGEGIPAASLSVPRRYSHSPVELMNLHDAVDLHNVLLEIVKNNQQAELSFL